MMRNFSALLLMFLVWGLTPTRAADDALGAAANHAFLATNAHKPGVIVRPSGLQYRILRNGFGAHPTAADTVQISYSAHLINSKLVDTATADLPAVMIVSNVLRGLNEALQLMQTGDHWELVLPSDLAFGGKGTPDGNVPPNQTLVFDITLMSVTPGQVTQGQVSSGVSFYGRDRGIGHEAGAMFTIPQ
ncbi:MAG: FKBP-type peptidyl-prolyl cis-trans isomerase [Rhizomicrobium sp.]